MNGPRIETYRFGRLVVDGQIHTKDLIILPARVVPGWWRRSGHELHTEDLEELLSSGIEVLVVGQGAYARMRVPPKVRRAIEAAGIRLVAQPTDEACQTYNRLRTERSVAAALHLTC